MCFVVSNFGYSLIYEISSSICVSSLTIDNSKTNSLFKLYGTTFDFL